MWQAGIDEAGRGCLCGGLFVAGVIGEEHTISNFRAKDSKVLSPKRRESIYQAMLEAYHRGEIGLYVVEISSADIDRHSLSWAMRQGIQGVLDAISAYVAMAQIAQKLSIFIDGNTTFGAELSQNALSLGLSMQTLIKGDSLMEVISCASVAAKVCKDRQMQALDKLYPQYKLAKNKGYGTLEHRRSIAQYGLCPHHRRSFKCC